MKITMLYVRVHEAVRTWLDEMHAERDDRADRGDVPGWVLVTVMTAGLVTVLWAIAGNRFSTMLNDALDRVTGN